MNCIPALYLGLIIGFLLGGFLLALRVARKRKCTVWDVIAKGGGGPPEEGDGP